MSSLKCPLCNKENKSDFKNCSYCNTLLDSIIKNDSISFFKKISNIFNGISSDEKNICIDFLKVNKNDIINIIKKLDNFNEFIIEINSKDLDKYYKIYEEGIV